MPEYHSVSSKLREEKRITEEFEIMLNSLTFEELFALRLELAIKQFSGKFYGFKIWGYVTNLIKDSTIKAVYNLPLVKKEKAALLGITVKKYDTLNAKYKVKEFFKKKLD